MKEKHILRTLLALAISSIFILSSCDKLKGEGGNVRYTLDVDSFISLDIDIPCDINISYGDTAQLTIDAQQNIIDKIYARKESHILYLEVGQKLFKHNPITLYFKMPKLSNIVIRDHSNIEVSSPFNTKSNVRFSINGTSHINFTDTFSCTDFTLNTTGSSILDATHLECQRKMVLECDGRTEVRVKGKTQSLNINVDNHLVFYGYDFESANTTIAVAGNASPVEVNVSNKLDVNVSGTANVSYKGSPTLFITDSLGTLVIDAIN